MSAGALVQLADEQLQELYGSFMQIYVEEASDEVFARLGISNDPDDATLELFMTNAGQPLAGAHGENKRHLPWSQYSEQFSCMQRLMHAANVVHYDLMAKQVLAKRDSRGAMQLTLADFDESSVDELSCPCTGSGHLTLTL